MSQSARDPREFRARLLAREPMMGTFLHIPATQSAEVLGADGLDFVVLDEEHAPWTRTTLDTALLATRAFGIAGLVRIARPDASSVLSALDDGAIGIIVPHVDTAAKARAVASWARYHGGTRGAFAGRGGEYGGRGDDNRKFCDDTTAVICMIEDRQALDEIDAIAAVDGVDALMLGQGDLRLSLGNAPGPAPSLREAVDLIVAAANRANKPLVGAARSMSPDDAQWLLDLGIRTMVVGSDLSFVREAAGRARHAFRLATQSAM